MTTDRPRGTSPLHDDASSPEPAAARFALGTERFTPDTPGCLELLDTFAAAGGRIIDTAAIYGHGRSERAIGAWLRSSGAHRQIQILTKGVHPDADWLPRVTPEAIASDLAESLDRLGVDRVHLYMLHRDDPRVPVAEVIDALNRHITEGTVESLGASNWGHERIEAANTYAAGKGLRGFSASSVQFSLAVPQTLPFPGCVSIGGSPEARAWYRSTQLPLFAWTPQAKGYFGARPGQDASGIFDTPDNQQRAERARLLAAKKQCSPTQVALAWLLGQAHPVVPVIGPRSTPQLQESLASAALTLSSQELSWLALEREV